MSLSGSIWRRLDTGRSDQLLRQTKISLPSRGDAVSGSCLAPGTAGLGTLPARTEPARPAPVRLNHTWAQLARGSGKARVKNPASHPRSITRQRSICLALGSSARGAGAFAGSSQTCCCPSAPWPRAGRPRWLCHRGLDQSRARTRLQGHFGHSQHCDNPASPGEDGSERGAWHRDPKMPPQGSATPEPSPADGRWEPGFPLQHHLVFSSFLAISSPLPPAPGQTPWSNVFFSQKGKEEILGAMCPSPFLHGRPWHLWAGWGQISVLLQLQEKSRSQAAKQEEKIILD